MPLVQQILRSEAFPAGLLLLPNTKSLNMLPVNLQKDFVGLHKARFIYQLQYVMEPLNR